MTGCAASEPPLLPSRRGLSTVSERGAGVEEDQEEEQEGSRSRSRSRRGLSWKGRLSMEAELYGAV